MLAEMITKNGLIACASCWLVPWLASFWSYSRTLLGIIYSNKSKYSTDLCPPAHNRALHFLIYPMGSLFIFIDQTICSGILSFGTCLAGINFQCPWLVWYCNSLFIDLINSALSGWLRASSRCMVSGSVPMKAKNMIGHQGDRMWIWLALNIWLE